jgi:hypothetical protein
MAGPAESLALFRQNYAHVLSTAGLISIKYVTNNELIISIARGTYRIVDTFYLDKNFFCTHPLYNWEPQKSRRILLYNLSPIYEEIPSRFLRIVGAMPHEFQLGAFSGFFVNNQTTTLVTQFMTGMPLLTALYVMPKYDFARMGSYAGQVPWGYFNVRYLFDPFLRKLSNIAGIDIFTVDKSKLPQKPVPNATLIHSNINVMFDAGTQSYMNNQSYGMAYLANHIYREDPAVVKHDEDIIKNSFAHADNPDPIKFTNATNVFYQKLNRLSELHDIILESSIVNEIPKNEITKPAGAVEIKGIVGERALFTTNCARENCTFVANIAYAPGWHAFVNGRAATIDRANFAFMSTTIPNGNSTVWLIYNSLPKTISYFVSLLFLLGIAILSSKRNR